MPYPPKITDWLERELDAKLATFATDQERYRELILISNMWTYRFRLYADFGRQPFNSPHPHYGDMTAFDFAIVMADIERRRGEMEREKAA
jgi:hypothetical protein